MKIIILLMEVFLTIAVIHLISILVFNLFINPLDPSTFTKLFPYQFLYNLIFSPQKPNKPYFSLRVDINTSQKNVEQHNEGLANLINLANQHNIPITFSIASEYIPALSEEVKELIKEPQHEIISHSHTHSDLTKKDQDEQIRKSKAKLQDTFNKEVKGLIAPQAKHNHDTLRAAKKNDIRYLSAGTLSYIRYWSFPYPFKKQNVWLIGGDVPSDYYLYRQKDKTPNEALKVWKEAMNHRAEKGWFIQLEYHNFSTSEEELKVLEELFEHIQKKQLEPVTQGELVGKINQNIRNN